MARLPVVTQYIQSGLEVEHAANELAERYEEINLLYSISEILGRAVTLDETARTILGEVSGTVGARRGAILVYDRTADALLPVAVLGTDVASVRPIPLGDESSVSSRVFRQLHAVQAETGEMENELESQYRRGAMLSVPIMRTAPAPRGSERTPAQSGEQRRIDTSRGLRCDLRCSLRKHCGLRGRAEQPEARHRQRDSEQPARAGSPSHLVSLIIVERRAS